MKRVWKIGLAAALLAFLAGAYFSWPGHAPADQPALIELDSKTMSALQAEFNRTAASLRVILLLPPRDPLACGGSPQSRKFYNVIRAAR